MEPERLRAPLDAEHDAVRRLTEYEDATDLGDAIARVSDAIEQVLRRMLRAEPAADDDARLAALSGLSADEVVVSLRRADTITMELAGQLAQLRETAGRARTGEARAADADLARSVLEALETTIRASRPPVAARPPAPPVATEPRAASRSPLRMVLFLVVAALVGIAGWIILRDRAPAARAGVEAFAAGRLVEAEGVFRDRVESGAAGATDWLYLGRIERRSGRYVEAAASLRTAADLAPGDDDVRRELGWLFLDLEKPEPAAGQFREAVRIDSTAADNWIGLIYALRAAGDPSAGDWLARAPDDVRTRLEAGTAEETGR